MLLLGYRRDGTLHKRSLLVDLVRVKLAALSAARDKNSHTYRVTLVDPLAGDRLAFLRAAHPGEHVPAGFGEALHGRAADAAARAGDEDGAHGARA